MENPVKEVRFESNGTAYRFVFGNYAIALVERSTGQTWTKFWKRISSECGASDLLSIFHAGLCRHHDVSEKQAADLMDAVGADKVLSIVKEGLGIANDGPRPTVKARASGKKN